MLFKSLIMVMLSISSAFALASEAPTLLLTKKIDGIARQTVKIDPAQNKPAPYVDTTMYSYVKSASKSGDKTELTPATYETGIKMEFKNKPNEKPSQNGIVLDFKVEKQTLVELKRIEVGKETFVETPNLKVENDETTLALAVGQKPIEVAKFGNSTYFISLN